MYTNRRRPRGLFQEQGFTLIELLIAVAIVSIIIAVALPNYSAYTRRAHRADAKIALTEMANLQEKYYSDNGVYADTLAELNYPAESPDGYYDMTITMADAAAQQDFTVTATGKNGQQNDTGCTVMSMNHFGSELPANTDCWSR